MKMYYVENVMKFNPVIIETDDTSKDVYIGTYAPSNKKYLCINKYYKHTIGETAFYTIEETKKAIIDNLFEIQKMKIQSFYNTKEWLQKALNNDFEIKEKSNYI